MSDKPTTTSTVQAAVAIIEITSSHEVLILRRAAHKNDHWSAHYAFPGGRCAKGDVNAFATAIRETEEEAGIQLSASALVQELSPTPAARSTASPVLVQPFHFALPSRPALQLNQQEIQTAHWLDLYAFAHNKGHAMREMLPDRLPGKLYPSYPIGDYFLWGFTYELTAQVFGTPSTLLRL